MTASLPFDYYLKRSCMAEFRKQGFCSRAARDLAEEVVQSFQALPMEKKASFLGEGPAMASSVAAGLSSNLGKVGVGLLGATLVGGALMGLSNLNRAMVTNPMQASQFNAALQQAIQREPVLQRADKMKVNALAATIFKYAPTAAADSNLLASTLLTSLEAGGIDMKTIDMLTNLEGRMRQTNKQLMKDYAFK
jgi:hypothetical protein